MPTSNAVDTATNVVSTVTSTFSSTVSQQAEQGRQLLQQILTWLTQDGITLAINLLGALLILFIGSFVTRGVLAAVRKALQKSKRVDQLLETFICSVVSKTCWAILFILALGHIGVDVAPLIASLGVTGVVLGFAFKESLGSLAAGLMIALNHPFKVGDYIIAGGVEGSVTELNMMATVLTTPDNKKITVANGTVWNSAITNFSALGIRRVDTVVGVAYGTDLSKALRTAEEALKSVPGVLAEPAPTVSIALLDNSAITLNVRPWSSCADYWNVYSGTQKAVSEAFAKAGIEIPFPQVDVHMKNA